MKKCSKCSIEKELDSFYKCANYVGGYNHTCRLCFAKRSKDYALRNKEKVKNNLAKWKSTNRKLVNQKQRKWRKDNNYQAVYLSDINRKLAHYLRTRLNKAIKGKAKAGSAVDQLGCSILELKQHLELKFKDGMTWENQGHWHIDHVQPLSSFDLTNIDQLKIVCHYTNLQPLWAKENISKGAKQWAS